MFFLKPIRKKKFISKKEFLSGRKFINEREFLSGKKFISEREILSGRKFISQRKFISWGGEIISFRHIVESQPNPLT